MKVIIKVSNSGEFKDIDFENQPIHIPIEVEVIEEEE